MLPTFIFCSWIEGDIRHRHYKKVPQWRSIERATFHLSQQSSCAIPWRASCHASQVTSTGTTACSMRHSKVVRHEGDIRTKVYTDTGRDRRRSIFMKLTTEKHAVLSPLSEFLGLCRRISKDFVCRNATAKEGSVCNTGCARSS